MQNINTEIFFENQLASLKIEGYTFSASEIENVKKCLSGEISFQQFANNLIKELKEG